MLELCIGFAVLVGGIAYLLLSPAVSRMEAADLKRRQEEAKLRLVEAKIAQLPEQTRGITERYRMTRENRINAMIRQAKQELEIAKLQEQIKILRQQAGTSEHFDPDE